MKKFAAAAASAMASLLLGYATAEAAQPGPSIDQLTGVWNIVDESGALLPIHDQANLIIYRNKLAIGSECSQFQSTGPLTLEEGGGSSNP